MLAPIVAIIDYPPRPVSSYCFTKSLEKSVGFFLVFLASEPLRIYDVGPESGLSGDCEGEACVNCVPDGTF